MPDAESPIDVPEPAGQDAPPDGAGLGALLSQYGRYVGLFVGAGLISGSVVHFPLAPVRYAVIGAVGAAVFVIASVASERAADGSRDVKVVAAAALGLALGIGMISGSIQHFADVPAQAAVLIPLGLVLSAGAFLVHSDARLRAQHTNAIGMWAVLAAIVLHLGLSPLADRLGGGGGHGHGEAKAAAPAPKADAQHAKPAGDHADKAADDHAAKPADGHADKRADKGHADKPADEHAAKPARKPATSHGPPDHHGDDEPKAKRGAEREPAPRRRRAARRAPARTTGGDLMAQIEAAERVAKARAVSSAGR